VLATPAGAQSPDPSPGGAQPAPDRYIAPAAPVQAPQFPLITAEDAGELVLEGILADRLLVLSGDEVAETVERHARDREGFLRSQIDDSEGT